MDPTVAKEVIGGVTQGISMLGQSRRSEKAHERNLEYMDIQNQNQQGLNTQQYNHQRGLNQMGHDLQYDMWNKTNYKAQVEHMKKAGLNPALMYGTPGQGGSTGSQGGGSASGGSASGASAPSIQPMDMQNLMMGAQIANLNANTKLTEAKAGNEAGGIKDNLTKLGKKMEADIKEVEINNEINERSKESQIKTIRQTYIKDLLDTELVQKNISLSETKKNQLEHKIWQEWAKVGFKAIQAITDILPKKVGDELEDWISTNTGN